MSFLERYKNGEMKAVYSEVKDLGEKAFNKEHYENVLFVLHETFKRSAFNLNVIYQELLEMGYNFKKEYQYNFERPILLPLKNSDKLLQRLDKTVKPFGHVPESLKMFYKVVGACNFAWDYDSGVEILWEGADPIQIVPVDDLLSELTESLDEEARQRIQGTSIKFFHW